jgi:hypothetical protein
MFTIASAAIAVRAIATVRLSNGLCTDLTISTVVLSAARALEEWESPNGAPADGEIIQVTVYTIPHTAQVARGQVLVRVAIGATPGREVIAEGYCYSMGAVTLGQRCDPGPGGGSGWQRIRELVAESAPGGGASIPLATSHTFQIVRTIGVWYVASADVAARTVQLSIRNHGTIALPVGFANAIVQWFVSMALSASQYGSISADRNRAIVNTNATVVVSSQASDPSPMPLEVEQLDVALLVVVVGSAAAADRMNVMALVEEWITW